MNGYLGGVLCVLLFGSYVKADTLCVAPLANNTGEEKYDALSWGIRDVLASSLGNYDDLIIVEREQIEATLREQFISALGMQSKESAVKVGKLLGAERLLTGGFLMLNGKFAVVIHIVDIHSARLMASVKETASPKDLLLLSMELADKLHEALASGSKKTKVGDTDKNPIASTHFMRGLGLFYSGNRDSAIMEFMKANRLDPSHTPSIYFTGLSYFEKKQCSHASIEFNRYLKREAFGPYAKYCYELLEKCRLMKLSFKHP